MGGARLYRSQTARVNAPVRSLIASGPQFLHVRNAGPGRVQIGFGPFRGLCRPTVRQVLGHVCGKVMYSTIELCGRGRTIPEPDRLGQSVSSATICLRPPIPSLSTGCRPRTGLGLNRTWFGTDSEPMSAYCATGWRAGIKIKAFCIILQMNIYNKSKVLY